MSWVLQNDLLYRYGFKHEVFLVLKDSYSHASEQARLAIVGRAVQGPQSDLPDDTKEYETYNLLYWLTTAAPDCLHAKARFSEIAGRHPDFGPRPHPDMDSWFESYSGSWEGQQSPLTLEQVLLKRPEELLNFLESLNPDEFRSSGREGVLRKVGEAVAQSFDWSMHLADFLKELCWL